MFSLDEIPDVKHYSRKKVKHQREAHGQKRRIYKEKPDLGYRNIKAFAKIGAYTKRVPFKKSKYSL